MADYELFKTKAPEVMRDLIQDFGFDEIQAAAILGNIGHECAGFRILQEINPVGGRGGYGWCQWTGPRRRSFESYAAQNGFAVDSDEANYGFLTTELRGSERRSVTRLKSTSGLIDGVRVFEQAFLRAGVKHYPSRERYADIALSSYQDADTIEASPPLIHDTTAWNAVPPKQAIQILSHPPKGIVIHHTTNPNTADTSLGHAFSIARSIQTFHMGPQRGWIDTGQHFTISRGGHIMEGRHRSLEVARGGKFHVMGAHADAACNRNYVGIENEGLYNTVLPPAAQWNALVDLCVWLVQQYNMSPEDIIGHRECKATECPGDQLFAALPQLRDDVTDRL